jgi:glycosyltransferase involved in cell wall biosynthesis
MGRAWLLAAPSRTAADGDCEGLPTVILEAAASGTAGHRLRS